MLETTTPPPETVFPTPIKWSDETCEAEHTVAQAAAELELGIKSSDEIKDYQEVFEAYKGLLFAQVVERLGFMVENGATDRHAKLDVIDQLVAAKASLIHETRRIELGESVVERGKEQISRRGKIARAVGGIALVMAGAKLGAQVDGAIDYIPHIGTAVGAIGAGGVGASLGKFAGKSAKERFADGDISKDELKTLGSIEDDVERRQTQIEMQHDHHLDDIREQLRSASMNYDTDTPDQREEYVFDMIAVLEASIDDVFDANSTWTLGAAKAAMSQIVKDRIGVSLDRDVGDAVSDDIAKGTIALGARARDGHLNRRPNRTETTAA